MALGKPAIPTPNQLELRAVQTAISNARQRIEALESSLSNTTLLANNAGSTSSAQIASLRALIDALDVRVTALENAATGLPDSADDLLAARAFLPHVNIAPATSATVTANDADLILAGQVFGD